ncbi:hypothetical protein [Staphylococcus equorum]|nr:hypothetical protein [Staphylococcus equorum]MDK9853859.1 hypothetical protein [Staphylococcus equorum]
MNGLIREIYGLSEFDIMDDDDEKSNTFGYLEENINDDMRAERDMG